MKKLYLFVILSFLSCNIDEENETFEPIKSSWVFVACEGNYGASNGSITMIKNDGEIKSIENIGDVVQSLEVYNNKLFVIINNSHKILAYDITENGLRLPGIEIDTNNSSPREMKIIDDKLYFTNWNTSDIKILNLTNYVIEESIKIDGKPESIEYDGTNLWVGVQLNNDYSDGNELIKFNPQSNSILESFEIGKGPTSISFNNNNVYIANTYYDDQYNAFYGTSKLNGIDNEIDIEYYGPGVVCGGDVMNFDNQIFRSYDGGLAKLDKDLKILKNTKLGSFDPAQLYSSKIIGNYIYFGITNFKDLNMVKVVDFNNNIVSSFDVGIIPGDFAYWKQN